MSLPSVGRGVPPQREAVKQGPAPTPSPSPPPSSPPTIGRGSASLSTRGSRSPASPQRGEGRKGQIVNDFYQDRDEGNGKKPCKYVIPAGRTASFNGNNQEDEYPLAGEGKCHKKLFEGREQVQSRKPNLKRFICPNQIRSINRTLTSNSQKTPIASDFQKTPIASDSQKTSSQKNSLVLIDGDTPISDSEKTPNPYPGDGGDSSVRWTREKSFTPTLTDLENSVHYDCRLDKVLRVAIDYARPEELGH
ncbi:uncharacterized protein [Miscanthus floridulus]|uniref:uncharacterized protein n=1 Tax=Miscanthus floridulus TaxID=154761 RepID=UPI0034589249